MDEESVYGIPVSSFTHLVVADLERKCHRARSVLFDVDPSMCGLVRGLQNNCCWKYTPMCWALCGWYGQGMICRLSVCFLFLTSKHQQREWDSQTEERSWPTRMGHFPRYPVLRMVCAARIPFLDERRLIVISEYAIKYTGMLTVTLPGGLFCTFAH